MKAGNPGGERSVEDGVPVAIVDVEAGGAVFDSVLTLWRLHRKWLGFLPTQGFTDRAEKGTLLAAVRGSSVVGYVLYDLPRDRVKVIHLCVAEAQRGAGIARALIDEVSHRHRDRRGMQLACRRDYPANAAWPHLGFVPRQERPGRNDAGLPLTIWFRDHGHRDLFTFTPESDSGDRLAVVLDHNVVIDLLSKRDESSESVHLQDPWLTEYIVLCITDEVEQEINKCEDVALRERMRAELPQFQRLSTPSGVDGGWEELVPTFEASAPRADPADHRHLARAKAGGASYFVSRDGRLDEAREQIHAMTGVEVMRPEELIAHIDRLRAQERYEPTALHATSLSIRTAVGTGSEFVRRFLNYADGERKPQLESELRKALAAPTLYEALVVADATGTLVGGLVRRRHEDTLDVQVMRVGGSDRLSYATARQLAYLQREEAARSARAGRVVIRDQHVSGPVRYALELEGYQFTSEGWVSEVQRGVFAAEDVPELRGVEGGDAAELAAALERTRWPMKVIGAGLSTFVIPIRPPWAEQLFDSTLAAQTLFGREPRLGLSREHVYYRSPLNANRIAAPARLLWYVSGQTTGQAEGSIRAVSQLAEIVVGRPRTIHQRFARLGVFDVHQVLRAAGTSGRVMALRFTDTELLEKPIRLTEIHSIAQSEGGRFVAPPSPRQIDEMLFARLYREASAHA